MDPYITADTLRNFAYVNTEICRRPVQGIVLSFFGLGNTKMLADHPAAGVSLGERGILYVHPYNDPWNWMNKQAVAITDEILDVLFESLQLPKDLPVVSTGGSMGGLCALVYTRYARRTPVACVANCPVCDLPYHLTERPDLPRTLYSAFYHEQGTLTEVLRSASPLHLVPEMPDVDYTLFHCTADKAVSIERHSDRFVAAMQAAGRRITYHVIPHCGHCDLPEEARLLFHNCAVSAILK